MYRGNTSRIFPIILIIIITIVVIAALVSASQAIFGNKNQNETKEVDRSETVLLSTADSASVKMIVRGPLVADEKHRSFEINISPKSRDLDIYEGYLQTPLEKVNLGNNVQAYDEFVHALNNAGYMKGEALVGENDDVRGRCATGRVYEFFVMDGSDAVKRLWTSTCKGSVGSLKANVSQIYNLFLNQIPDGAQKIRDKQL